jgi:hypothetical protein
MSEPEIKEKKGSNSDVSMARKPKIAAKVPLLLGTSFSGLRKSFCSENTDIAFVNENDSGQMLPAHKMVLSVSSPFFFEKLQGDWKEKDQDRLPVPGGFQWSMFKIVIDLLYGEQVEVEEDLLVEIYRAAHYLQLDKLKMAIDKGFATWNLENVAVAIEMCIQAEIPRNSKEFVARHIKKILDQELDFTRLTKETILDISMSENVKVSEAVLHAFLTKWTEAHEDRLSFEDVQKIFGNIRYGTIKEDDLRTLACSKYYHNLHLGTALKQQDKSSTLDMSVVRAHPVQYCSRKFQAPFPGPAVFRNELENKSCLCVVYSGHSNATLIGSGIQNAWSNKMIIKCSSISSESQYIEIKVGEHVRRSNHTVSQSTRGPTLLGEFLSTLNAIEACCITLNARSSSIQVSFLSKKFKEWPAIGSSSVKRFNFNGPVPWLVEITYIDSLYTA